MLTVDRRITTIWGTVTTIKERVVPDDLFLKGGHFDTQNWYMLTRYEKHSKPVRESSFGLRLIIQIER